MKKDMFTTALILVLLALVFIFTEGCREGGTNKESSSFKAPAYDSEDLGIPVTTQEDVDQVPYSKYLVYPARVDRFDHQPDERAIVYITDENGREYILTIDKEVDYYYNGMEVVYIEQLSTYNEYTNTYEVVDSWIDWDIEEWEKFY